jgi:hypothetical protein
MWGHKCVDACSVALHQQHLHSWPSWCGQQLQVCMALSPSVICTSGVHRLVADPMPVQQMYHNSFSETPGKLTVPRSKRTTSQLEGYHGAALNHVVRGYNTSAELAIPQLTLTNDSWNQDREVSEVTLAWTLAKRSGTEHIALTQIAMGGVCILRCHYHLVCQDIVRWGVCMLMCKSVCHCCALQVVAGKVPEYYCHDRALLQDISSKLQHLGVEPLAGEWSCWGIQAGCMLR